MSFLLDNVFIMNVMHTVVASAPTLISANGLFRVGKESTWTRDNRVQI